MRRSIARACAHLARVDATIKTSTWPMTPMMTTMRSTRERAPSASAVSRVRAARWISSTTATRRASGLPEHVVIPMPALSPTMSSGGIAKWHAAIGDEVRAGDVLADVETDKATMAMEATDDGFLAAILVEEGATDVEVGTPVCVMLSLIHI